jgi:hypothetical protein
MVLPQVWAHTHSSPVPDLSSAYWFGIQLPHGCAGMVVVLPGMDARLGYNTSFRLLQE